MSDKFRENVLGLTTYIEGNLLGGDSYLSDKIQGDLCDLLQKISDTVNDSPESEDKVRVCKSYTTVSNLGSWDWWPNESNMTFNIVDDNPREDDIDVSED